MTSDPTPLFAKDRKPKPDKRPLLEPHELAEQGPPEAIRLPLDLVDENPNNPRQTLAEVDALADNIKTFGLLQPVTVRRQGDRYELIGGHRRRAAFLLLREHEPHDPQWRTIPAVVRTFDDDTSYLALLSSQLHSKSWRPREEAMALERLAETRTLPQVGLLVNKSAEWIGIRLRVYADAVLSGFVQTGKLTPSIAQELLLVKDTDIRRDYAERAVAEQWTASEARAEVRKLKASSQVGQIGRLTNQLVDLLSAVKASDIPLDVTRDLWVLVGRVQTMARGGPILPTIEEAQQAAGVNPDRPAKRHRTRLRID